MAPREANVSNNNSHVAPIRGLDFGEFLGTKELPVSTTPNLQTLSARTGKFVAVSLPISYLYAMQLLTSQNLSGATTVKFPRYNDTVTSALGRPFSSGGTPERRCRHCRRARERGQRPLRQRTGIQGVLRRNHTLLNSSCKSDQTLIQIRAGIL